MRKCEIEGCHREHAYGGLCYMHMLRRKRGVDPSHNPRAHLQTDYSPTTRELEWAAGFLEGEGHFGAGKTGGERISGTQVDSESIAKLKKLFGGRVHLHLRKQPAQDIFTWEAYGARARGVMLTLFPLLSERRQEQIRAALAVKPKLFKTYDVTAEAS